MKLYETRFSAENEFYYIILLYRRRNEAYNEVKTYCLQGSEPCGR
jgi:hypothetical protein